MINELTMLDEIFIHIKDFIEVLGVAVITYGALVAAYQIVMLAVWKKFSTRQIRLQFGTSVVLGLELMVGADIIGSLIKPDYYSLGLLAVIVAIRTVLSFFLNRELEELSPQQKEHIK